MNTNIRTLKAPLLLTVSLFAFSTFASSPAYAADTATLTVTAVAKQGSPPPIKKEDAQVFEGKERVQVADWRHGENLYLAILIDDSLDSEVASQWGDLRAFIAEQPATTLVAVAYARNGGAMIVQDFTADHALAAKAPRI